MSKSKTPHDIILHPLFTEKAARMKEEEDKVCFVVRKDANKIEIRQAVEKLFDVKVAHVHTQIVRGKVKRLGRNVGKRSNWKKAVITLAPGIENSIEFFETA
jgi:large subunit ribosomal protein L23